MKQTNIEIDEQLVEECLDLTGIKHKKRWLITPSKNFCEENAENE